MKVTKRDMDLLLDAVQRPVMQLRNSMMDKIVDENIWETLDAEAIKMVSNIWSEQKKILGYE